MAHESTLLATDAKTTSAVAVELAEVLIAVP